LYTDGVIEAQNGVGEQYGSQRLMQQLRSLAGQPVTEIRDGLAASVGEFMAEQRDDIALLVARYRAPA